MPNLHTLLCFKIGIYFTTESVNLHRKLPAERGWDCDGLDRGLDKQQTQWKHPYCVGWGPLTRFPISLQALLREGKTKFDSAYQRNKPKCFKVWDKLHKVKSHKTGWWNGNPDTSFLTGDRIDDSRRKCILLKRRMNYDSFHIKQTYLWQRALRAPSTSTDTITNWPANHLALASKVQIRYLRSLKEDSAVCRFPLCYYRNHVLL